MGGRTNRDMNARGIIRFLLVGAVCYLVFCGTFLAVQWWFLSPNRLFASIKDQGPYSAEADVRSIQIEGSQYLVVFGRSLPFNEEDSAYLFDDEGRFITWSPEASDADSHAEIWVEARRNGRVLGTVAEVRKKLH